MTSTDLVLLVEELLTNSTLSNLIIIKYTALLVVLSYINEIKPQYTENECKPSGIGTKMDFIYKFVFTLLTLKTTVEIISLFLSLSHIIIQFFHSRKCEHREDVWLSPGVGGSSVPPKVMTMDDAGLYTSFLTK